MTTLVRRNSNLFPVFPTLFDDFFGHELPSWNAFNAQRHHSLPSVNVKETENEFRLEVAAPGLKKEDFKVNLENNVLTIASEKEEINEEKENGYARKEFSFNSFSRSFTLPEKIVDAEKIAAKYENGVLEILIPKREEEKPKPVKAISIN